jgi:tetratricopeptide (TPR) repeat protein
MEEAKSMSATKALATVPAKLRIEGANWMKMILVSALILGATLSACGQVSTTAIEELHAGARSFEAGQFVAAQQHFEKAIILEPRYRYGQLLLARALEFQYRPGVQSRANTAIAHKAISTYKNYLTTDPQNEIAFGSVATLYGSIRENELRRLWILERAKLESAPKAQRAECYIVLASYQWNCSFELREKPAGIDAKSLSRARQCVFDGLELTDKAIALDSANDLSWFYKAVLLREMDELGEKEGRTSKRAHFNRLADEAEARSQELGMKRPNTSDADEANPVTGDKELDKMFYVPFKLIYLAAPVPIKPV